VAPNETDRASLLKVKKDELAWLKNYYKNEKEAQRKLADEFKYVESSDAILLRG